MKKILVTGGCGYIGARLSKYLAEKGYGVTAFDSFEPSNYSHWNSLMEEVIIGDIRDETTLYSLVKKQFDVVIHLISLDHHKSEDNPNFVSSINVMPTWNILEKFSKSGLQKFIYFSTFQVYGKVPSKAITEDCNPSPQNNYGLTHLLSENICNYYNIKTNINCINVRLSNSYGSPVFLENNCWWLVINDLCKTAYNDKKIKLLSDGSPQRDFIHISDICRAIEVLLKTKNDDFQENTFHIASENTLTILELAHEVNKVFKKRYQSEAPIILPDSFTSEEPDKYKDIDRFVISTKNMESFGFHPKTDLIMGINEVFSYLEKCNENNLIKL